jgi:hypothetical protein
MQGGKNWILPKDINVNQFLILLRLSMAENLEKPLMSLFGTGSRERMAMGIAMVFEPQLQNFRGFSNKFKMALIGKLRDEGKCFMKKNLKSNIP